MFTPECVFCGHPTFVYNIEKQLHICPPCQRKLDEGLLLDYDLFSQQHNKNKR